MKSFIVSSRIFSFLGVWLFILAFASLSTSVVAQKTYVDSLRNELKIQQNDTLKILIMEDIAFAIYSAQPDTTIALANEALALSNKLSFDKGKGRALYLLGMDKYFQGDYDEAEEYFDKALRSSISASDSRELGRIFNSLGELAFEKADVITALDCFNKSISHKEKVDDVLGMAITYNNIATLFSRQGAYEKSLHYYRNSLSLRSGLKSKVGLSMVYNDLGNDYLTQDNYDSAFFYLKKGLGLSVVLGEQWGSANLLKSMSVYYLARKELDSAFQYMERAEEMAILTGSKDILAELLNVNAQYSNLKKDYKTAMEYAMSAIEKGEEMGKSILTKDGYLHLGEAQKGLGMHREAILSIEKCHYLTDSLSSARNNQKLLTIEYEKNLEKQRLQGEKERAILESELSAQKSFNYVVIMMFMALFLSMILLYRNYQSKKKSNASLREKQIQIEKINKKVEEQNVLLKAQKEEIEQVNDKLEERIKERTEELAETVQSLAVQNQNLEQFSYILTNNLKAPVDRISGLANVVKIQEGKYEPEIIESIFDSANNLNVVISDLTQIIKAKQVQVMERELVNLDEILRSVTDFFSDELREIDANITVSLAQEVQVYSVKSFLFSILVNLVSNSIKFRAVRKQLKINVTGIADKELYVLSVSDNGMGMDLTKGNDQKIFKLYQRLHSSDMGRGFGLYFIKTQIEALGGMVEVESEESQGAKFTLFFPYKKP